MHRIAVLPAARQLAQAVQKRRVFVNRALNARPRKGSLPVAARSSTFVPPLPGASSATNAAAHGASGATCVAQALTWKQVQAVVAASAVPMIGFGFMDNLVMVCAGSYIDATLGVQFGLATMTAAAAGQVFSDVSGVLFGGTVERLLSPWIKPPNLTPAQLGMPVVARLRIAGAVGGVILGCILGASSLLFVLHDEDEAERHTKLAESLRQLRGVARDLLAESKEATSFATCAIHVADMPPATIPSNEWGSDVQLKKLDASVSSGAEGLTENGTVLNLPIRDDKEKVLAILRFKSSSSSGFTDDDRESAERVTRQLAIVLKRMVLV